VSVQSRQRSARRYEECTFAESAVSNSCADHRLYGLKLQLGSLGDHSWNPIDIKDIYRLQADNPRLTLYVPDPSGSVLELDPDRPTVSRSQ